jgi:gliding-associated putative ABC transporter substrate-binding component GldG
MEFKFANAIEQLTQNNKAMIAYSYGNGEPTGANTYDLVENVLKKNYSLFTIDINKEPVIPDTFKLLMIVKPTHAFTEDEKIKIDQYVMHGGKVIWFLDRLNAEMDSLQLKNQVIAYDRNLNLEDLLFKYGVRINPDLLMDLQCDFLPFDVNGNKQFEFLHWNYFPLFESKSNHAINKNVGLVAGRFVNSIDTVKSDEVHKTILLSSSPNARTIATPALISGEENRNAPQDDQFKKKDVIAGVLLQGKFKSLYANRLPLNIMDTLQRYGTPFQTSSITDNKMIIVSDGDIVLNGVSQGQPLPMGVNAYTVETQYQYQFANRDFLQNCLDYLINNSGLAEAKSKDYTLRLLDPKKINDERTKWQIINIVLPILLIFIFGFIYQFWRRKKYSR